MKQTLGGQNKQGQKQEWKEIIPNDEQAFSSEEMMDYNDKVDSLMEKEEEMISKHMQLIKENAQLLTKEGELISYV